MVRKYMVSAVAMIAMIGLVVSGCTTPTPDPATGPVPVEVNLLIRADLAPWPQAGHWIGDRLEDAGFKVIRTVRTGATASPIWIGTHPREGKMHIYTGGWISPAIPRNQGTIFDQMYTHRVMAGFGLWDVLEEQLADPAYPRFQKFDEASRKLRFTEFKTMTEREALFKDALEIGMEFANCLWIADVAGTNPYKRDVRLASNVAGGIGDPNWVHTTHRFNVATGQPIVGGDIKIEFPNLFNEPWNPVAGSSWSYDMFPTRRAVGDAATMSDPGPGATGGLPWPQRLAGAEVWVDQGLPIGQTIDWGGTFVFNQIPATSADLTAPADAWADWDPVAGKFLTVAERAAADADYSPTALTKTRVVYQSDLWDIPLHDGSTISPADFLMGMIYTFDRGKEASPVYEPTAKAALEAWLKTFKGFQIVSVDPLTIDTWSDTWYLDAEMFPEARNWFPLYGTYGWTGFWHMIAVGWAAEAKNTGATGGVSAAWTLTKSDAQDPKVPYMDYTKGPTLPILKTELAWAKGEGFIPYEAAIAPLYDAWDLDLDAEIAERWAKLEAFQAATGHFWVGNGPYWIASTADLSPPSSIILTRFPDYPDPADKWFQFMPDAPAYTGDRMGVFPDRVILAVETSHATAVAKLKDSGAGGIDIYAFGITDVILVDDIKANLSFDLNLGSYRDIRFNTYRDPETKAPFFDEDFGGRMNPFAIPEIREAMNYLLNRPLIVALHLVGAGAPKWTALGTAFPDYARYYDSIVEPIEEKYAFDAAKGIGIIETQMLALGCEKILDPSVGREVWHFDYGD